MKLCWLAFNFLKDVQSFQMLFQAQRNCSKHSHLWLITYRFAINLKIKLQKMWKIRVVILPIVLSELYLSSWTIHSMHAEPMPAMQNHKGQWEYESSLTTMAN